MTIVDSRTGHLLGVIGGAGSKEGNRVLNRGTQAYYPPGSALKPLSVYGPALEETLVHYGMAFEDLPETTQTGVWPHNSPNIYDGRIPLHAAIAKSKNTVSVEVLRRLGKEKAFSYLKNKLHFQGLIRDSGGKTDVATAPLALGQLTYGVTAKEMTSAFASFANGGEYITPASYLVVYDKQGEPLLRKETKKERVWSKDTAYIMTKMLEEVVDVGTARRITLKEVVATAGKTGTSGGDKDKWFVGYTPYCVGAIHTGFDDGSGMLPGDITHLKIWDEVMIGVHRHLMNKGEGDLSFQAPPGVIYASYCRDSGLSTTEHCEHELRGDRTEWGYFKTGHIKKNNH
jgi:penicillin-binding protein 1A